MNSVEFMKLMLDVLLAKESLRDVEIAVIDESNGVEYPVDRIELALPQKLIMRYHRKNIG